MQWGFTAATCLTGTGYTIYKFIRAKLDQRSRVYWSSVLRDAINPNPYESLCCAYRQEADKVRQRLERKDAEKKEHKVRSIFNNDEEAYIRYIVSKIASFELIRLDPPMTIGVLLQRIIQEAPELESKKTTKKILIKLGVPQNTLEKIEETSKRRSKQIKNIHRLGEELHLNGHGWSF